MIQKFSISCGLFVLLSTLCVAGRVYAQGVSRPKTPVSEYVDRNRNTPGIQDPVLSQLVERDVRIPGSDQVLPPSEQVNIIGKVRKRKPRGSKSLRGKTIQRVSDPQDDLQQSLKDLESAAKKQDQAAMRNLALEITSIVEGTTNGRVYDGFGFLHFNRGAFAPGQLAGEYKQKRLEDSGTRVRGLDGALRRVWEVEVNQLWFGEEFESDTAFLRVPEGAHEFDVLQVHFRIYSLVREELVPMAMLRDYRHETSSSYPFKAFDAAWIPVGNEEILEATVRFPSLGLVDGIQLWGRRGQPGRNQFVKLVRELRNVHSQAIELDSEGRSLVERSRALTRIQIGTASPEFKMLAVAEEVLAGASPDRIERMLGEAAFEPLGTWKDWIELAGSPHQLPPEVWQALAREGIPPGQFGPYDFVLAFLNQEIYGAGPGPEQVGEWAQGDRLRLRVFNLDQTTHYLQVWDLGRRLHFDMRNCDNAPGGDNSIEIADIKPVFGAAKEIELGWRSGFGFRRHLDILPQLDTFLRPQDRERLDEFRDGTGRLRGGWQFSIDLRGGDFVFDPPVDVIGSPGQPSRFLLSEGSGGSGLVIGQTTPGFGSAKLCDHAGHPPGSWCRIDRAPFHPRGLKNVDLDGDGNHDELWFPAWLRNPAANGGDLIAGTREWRPFQWIHPDHGGLELDPQNPALGHWVDQTFAHGKPIAALSAATVELEMPRASGQRLIVADGLFRDRGILSLTPGLGD